MNERIKLLANEAGYRNIFDNDTKAKARLEKFAELIVGECTKILADNSEFRSCVIIGKHFGVEE